MILDGRKLELAGRAAYEAYRIEVQGWSVHGEPLPTWSAQEERIRVAWRMAADAAVMVATGPAEPLPSRWQPVARIEPGKLYIHPIGTDAELPPQVDDARAAEAHSRASVVADDSDGDELSLRLVGAEGVAEGDQREHTGEQPQA